MARGESSKNSKVARAPTAGRMGGSRAEGTPRTEVREDSAAERAPGVGTAKDSAAGEKEA